MKNLPVSILGIPLQSSSIEAVVEQCVELLNDESLHPCTHPIFMVDGGQIAFLYGWGISSVKRPELLALYRKADVVVTSSKTLVFLSKCMGSPLSDAINMDALLSTLIKKLGKLEKGIFFLGSREKSAKADAVKFHESSPGLRIVGISATSIDVEGKDLANAPERDELLIEQINASNADLLIIHLDSPKKEIWFERVQSLLKTPLTIGITQPIFPHTFQTVDSIKSGNPLIWMNGIKLAWFMFPLVIGHNLSRLAFKLFYKYQGRKFPQKSLLFLSPERSIAAISLPPLLDHSNRSNVLNQFEEVISQDALVFDFRRVRHIQPEGFSLLIGFWQRCKIEDKEFYGFGVTSSIKRLMQLHKTWDLFETRLCTSAEILIARLIHENTPEFYDAISQRGLFVVISLFGIMGTTFDYESYLNKLTPIIGRKDCILDFSYASFVSNRGFSFLLFLRKRLLELGHRLVLCSLSPAVRLQFRAVKLEDAFCIVENIEQINKTFVDS